MIEKILVYNPETRLKPLQALQQPFFDDLRQEGMTLPNKKELPKELFDFSEEEKGSVSQEVIKQLTPSWWLKERQREAMKK